MNVINIVVDELPKSCFTCRFVEHHEMFKSNCGINYKGAYSASRPEWCPLVVEDEYETCTWKIKYIANNGIHEQYYFGCTEEKSKWADKKYNFCPNCGKRIRYEELP